MPESFCIEAMSFSYNGFLVFENFTTEFEGPMSILEGPSGCGKTTLLKIICRSLTPDSVAVLSPAQRPCLILQEDGLFPWLSGLSNIQLFTSASIADIKSHSLYHRVEPFIGKKAFQLSFGQRRILELFRAFLASPDILCLDEPLNFVDTSTRRVLVDMIYRLSLQSDGPRVFITSHYEADFSSLGAPIYRFANKQPTEGLCKIVNG